MLNTTADKTRENKSQFLRRKPKTIKSAILLSSLTPMNYFLLLCNLFTYSSFAQGLWKQKANYGATVDGAVSFSIGTKAYIVCGGQGCYFTQVWEWEQTTDVWTQKASYPGNNTYKGIGFSIGSKGYYGTGVDGCGSSRFSDFYEFDPVANTWTLKANIPSARFTSEGFSIGNKGYIVGGNDVNKVDLNDCYEYDPLANTWIAKTPYPGLGREGLSAFSIATKGYVGCGFGIAGGIQNDFWEFDPSVNTWTKKASFSGTARKGASSFSIGTKGYIGTGYDGSTYYYNDFWEWDQSTNVWTAIANFTGAARRFAIGCSIGTMGYIGTGYDGTNLHNDFWEFDPSVNGVNEINLLNSITVFPNPSSGNFTIKSEQEKINHIEVSNILGEKVFAAISLTGLGVLQTIDLNTQANGIYFIYIHTGKGIAEKKIIVNK
jgi:N-acetylneuraminic acid mutarotase